ncbi:hypothetical protein T484DRAFT_1644414, partial [Baffinella frigidus]
MACTAGFFSTTGTNSQCNQCPTGSTSEANSTNCTCVAGQITNLVSDPPTPYQELCTPCEAETLSGNAGAESYESCSANSTSTAGSAQCNCVAGYEPFSHGASCIACNAGTFKNMQGATPCENCSAGMYSGVGVDNCTVCVAGTYTSTEGSVECTACEAGTHTVTGGSETCVECEAGKYSGMGADELVDCECLVGYYKETSDGASPCKQCEAGTYKNYTGTGTCVACPAAFTSSEPGNDELADC